MIDTTPVFKMPKSPLSDSGAEASDYIRVLEDKASVIQKYQEERDSELFDSGYKLGCQEHDDAAYDTGYQDCLDYYQLPRKEEKVQQDSLGGIVPEIDMHQGFGVLADTAVYRGDDGTLRIFETGATRDTAEGKLDYEGFLSPLVLRRYAQYMDDNRVQSDGSVRDSDNWQKGIPLEAYMKSLWRHLMDAWTMHRKGYPDSAVTWLEVALCAIIFNASGYLHEILKKRDA